MHPSDSLQDIQNLFIEAIRLDKELSKHHIDYPNTFPPIVIANGNDWLEALNRHKRLQEKREIADLKGQAIIEIITKLQTLIGDVDVPFKLNIDGVLYTAQIVKHSDENYKLAYKISE